MTRLLQIALVSAFSLAGGAVNGGGGHYRRLPFCIPRGGASSSSNYSGILDGVKSQVLASASESVSISPEYEEINT
jgi:hypothetical protein